MKYINVFDEITFESTLEILDKIIAKEMEDNEIIEGNKKLCDGKDHKELEDLVININSNGGLIDCGLAIYDALKNLKCKVITKAYGCCSSIAFIILLAGDERYGMKHSRYLVHPLSYGLNNDTSLPDHISYLAFTKQRQKALDEIITANTRITDEMLEEKRKEDWDFLSEEALSLRVIKEII